MQWRYAVLTIAACGVTKKSLAVIFWLVPAPHTAASLQFRIQANTFTCGMQNVDIGNFFLLICDKSCGNRLFNNERKYNSKYWAPQTKYYTKILYGSVNLLHSNHDILLNIWSRSLSFKHEKLWISNYHTQTDKYRVYAYIYQNIWRTNGELLSNIHPNEKIFCSITGIVRIWIKFLQFTEFSVRWTYYFIYAALRRLCRRCR